MLDLKLIRETPDIVDRGLARRGLPPRALALSEKDARRRALQTEMQELQQRRNALSREIGRLKREGGAADALVAEVGTIKERLPQLEQVAESAGTELEAELAEIPNLLADDVPDGPDETANVVLREVGERPVFDFEPRQHFEIGEALGGMDFEAAAKLAGSRFVVLKGAIARLERALAQFMLDLHTREFGYVEVVPPLLVRGDVLYGTGQLPKFADDQFRTTDDRWLIPTAEVPLTNLVANEIVDPDDLPMRFAALTPCFRAEAGAAGRDTRGMLRQHQFSKVELVSIVHPDHSEEEQARKTNCAEEVLRRLRLPYRLVVLCGGDTGFSARKTHDIEVWLPGQQAYREISSVSNCGDFQARRMQARFRPAGAKHTEYLHTLNGSGLAVGRTLIAVIENFQRADGSIEMPHALRPYLGGLERIGGEGG
ncbi:MAG: serine--tRNA ligase [Acetobacterales bacterium]